MATLFQMGASEVICEEEIESEAHQQKKWATKTVTQSTRMSQQLLLYFVCLKLPGCAAFQQYCGCWITFVYHVPTYKSMSCHLVLCQRQSRFSKAGAMVDPNNHQPISVLPSAFEITLKSLVQVHWASCLRDHEILSILSRFYS